MNEPLSGQRIAFFGGSFDPPHLGHLAIARAAQAALALDTVLFAPVGAQPLKPRGSTASFAQRVAMTRLAIADESGFALSLADAPQALGAPNYTLETLLKLRAELPPVGELFCLMGADSFALLRHWHRAAEIPFAAALVVASRPGESLEDLEAALPTGLMMDAAPEPGTDAAARYTLRNAAGNQAPFYLLPNLEIEISASAIRRQIHAAGDSTLLPAPVLDYIRAHGLYRDLPSPD
ncbi:MAG: nicotinate (nicotinamide) nucleotide adenylyltransferase [Terracidiphilus sp.]